MKYDQSILCDLRGNDIICLLVFGNPLLKLYSTSIIRKNDLPIQDLIKKKNEDRKTLSYGFRWPRYIFIVLGFFILIDLILNLEDILNNLTQLAFCGMLYFIFYQFRRLQFDCNNLYIIKGGNETVVPFTSIISIKKSSTKVNGSRYYKILYKDEFGIEKIRRYFPRIFSESKDFIAAVKKANPDVVHWSHPFWGH